MAATLLLALFYAVDRWLWQRDIADGLIVPDPTPDRPLKITGTLNVALLVAIVGVVLLSGVWKPDLEVRLFGATIEAQSALRDVALIGITIASLRLTPRAPRAANQFSFQPMIEVAILFAGIFLTIIPALAILRAGHEGVLAPVLGLLAAPGGEALDARYFWLTGMLSSVLDNAPTYLVFFSLAGGDPVQLMGPMASTLAAISAGAVFMGANTYIGNAPNFMVKSIAESRGVRMPSFFAYLGWSLLVLGPVYLLLTWLFFN
jgi:Na+/H+ antiporter NhaD/arsenite permease-like protein